MLPIRLPLRLAARTRLTGQVISRPIVSRRVILPVRCYATPAKPKKGSIGETAKRGRAPKAATAKSTSTKKTTIRKPAAKKTATTKPPSKTALAKAASAQRAADRAAKSKTKKAETAAKKREAEKKRKDAAKAKEKSRAPAQKIKLLKEQALNPPAKGTMSAWLVYWQAAIRQNPERVKGTGAMIKYLKEAKQDFEQLSPSEKESYTRRANEEKEQKQRQYSAWVAGKPAEEIRLANDARRKLRALKVKGFNDIKDERQLKRPMASYMRFSAERAESGQHTGTAVEQARESARVWKGLSQSQKQDYIDAYEREAEQYKREYERLYGHAAPSAQRKKTASSP
ncbi:Hypothetical protein D9617_35g089940 [Elsinoe fawcettii]|nr:Hypothetical protein D9617_35g089940 [Elsinoe fawcettii]